MRKHYCVFLLFLMLGACTRDSTQPAKTVRAPDANRGRGVYLSNCAACHNSSDPSKDGPIGPAIKGSSQALIEARVLKAGYPPGYTPKRKTAMMSALPFLKSTIPDLAAFLGGNSVPLEKDQKQQMQDRGKDKAGPKSP
jgi:mono/diheme cytochrome c family protein